ncbi:MAG: hypothetical protein HY471_01470 [Candidatus Sungbacteria bacterium]|nr:hypothetical protein [Candidatus Sungbacteria bacterium]
MKLDRLGIALLVLTCIGLGLRLISGAYWVLVEFEEAYPHLAAADPDFMMTAKLDMPFDILSGLLLIICPAWLGWFLWPRRAKNNPPHHGGQRAR